MSKLSSYKIMLLYKLEICLDNGGDGIDEIIDLLYTLPR